MSDYISREAALKTVDFMYKACDTHKIEDFRELMTAGLYGLTAADVRQNRRGKWLCGYCSCCGERTVWDETDYCPNCGADMRGKE